ncbi:MAG: 5'/3'-nucleotidase SurE [Casimicrobiaceae bacterium]|jgi:5'-nucleotidase
MRILVSNDDGIGAPGLRTLVDAARTLAPDIWVVAPERKWTAASHQLSFDRVLTLTRVAESEYACSGAPADCVVAAMTLLFAEGRKPDLVLAGVNDKLNVAEDLAYSGTMAIAREATFWDVPAIGISRDTAGASAPAQSVAIANLLRVLWDGRAEWSGPGGWLSLNLPARLPAPLVQARVGRDKIGAACEILESTAESIAFRIARGRRGTCTEGDERAVVAAGAIALVRHNWSADAAIPRATVEAWDRALS